MDIYRARKIKLTLDLAPLIDIVFQLLVFFLLTSTFARPALTLNLPKASQGQAVPSEATVLEISQTGRFFLDGTQIPTDHVADELRKRISVQKDSAIHIRGDKAMPYSHFVAALDYATDAGAQKIHIIHARPDER